ncbi:hypothetical protein ABZ800_28000 [Streptomyces sp. NPDC047813]|uniref:hypothetical protein n=1 Tax=Streptomyces sp. NPDC047813 TaxID=3154608 RepID=UPI0033E0F7A7
MKRSDDLLAGLDDIDWAALGHAYGSAEDVPGQLRTVCGLDEEARESAFRSLFGNIFHQGTRTRPLRTPCRSSPESPSRARWAPGPTRCCC